MVGREGRALAHPRRMGEGGGWVYLLQIAQQFRGLLHMVGLWLTQAVQDSIEGFLIQQVPLLWGEMVGLNLDLLGGLGWWILQVSDPAAPYLDGLAQEWTPLGVGKVCRHGGWLCPSLCHPLAAAGWKQGSRRVMQRAPGLHS